MVALGWMDGGTRSLYLKKPIKTPADLKGQKVRMMGNPLFVDTMNAMGGNGISMGFGELYSALQTGVVDGAENNPNRPTSPRTITRLPNITASPATSSSPRSSSCRRWSGTNSPPTIRPDEKAGPRSPDGTTRSLGQEGRRVDRRA
jgi:hypothetical protein